MKKNIKIEVLADLYYARFIAIWRPEESPNYKAPENDSRAETEKNVPYILVTSSMYKGRDEVVGINPVVPSQHPMPASFLKQQVRHISYMFANDLGIFKPATKVHANLFLSKMRLGYTKIKEVSVEVSQSQSSITLKDFKDTLDKMTEDQLEAIPIMIIGENPEDAYTKQIDNYIHTMGTTTQQYISITKLLNVYDIEDPYIDMSMLPSEEDIGDSYAPGTEEEEMTQNQMNLTRNAIVNNKIEQSILKTFDEAKKEAAVEASIESKTQASEVVEPISRDSIQTDMIKSLQDEIQKLKNNLKTS